MPKGRCRARCVTARDGAESLERLVRAPLEAKHFGAEDHGVRHCVGIGKEPGHALEAGKRRLKVGGRVTSRQRDAPAQNVRVGGGI